MIGVDEHRWSHVRRRADDGYVTVIVDVTPVLHGTGRARLLDLVPGRSAAALKSWLSTQTATFRDQVEVVTMDGVGGYKTAVADELLEAPPTAPPTPSTDDWNPYAEIRLFMIDGVVGV